MNKKQYQNKQLDEIRISLFFEKTFQCNYRKGSVIRCLCLKLFRNRAVAAGRVGVVASLWYIYSIVTVESGLLTCYYRKNLTTVWDVIMSQCCGKEFQKIVWNYLPSSTPHLNPSIRFTFLSPSSSEITQTWTTKILPARHLIIRSVQQFRKLKRLQALSVPSLWKKWK